MRSPQSAEGSWRGLSGGPPVRPRAFKHFEFIDMHAIPAERPCEVTDCAAGVRAG